ncbi:Peptidyl-prolyl cis-trans isomerase CYP57 [Vitis vinifera]|uniref:Peptidyl-prolyl cis-trans isomerase CYP57 n=1 Tax=Vitis vinifera TaxID=29760 RepID=A0A438EXE6_VITVI|nr:Peptidyl-prolyl cis-trans isomerase CYP57 [Vitis vinifera]
MSFALTALIPSSPPIFSAFPFPSIPIPHFFRLSQQATDPCFSDSDAHLLLTKFGDLQSSTAMSPLAFTFMHLRYLWFTYWGRCCYWESGESIYGSAFADEFHSRLRFNHRGLVACANAGSPNSNGSQFFISLDRCDWLDRKNTIFGKVLWNPFDDLVPRKTLAKSLPHSTNDIDNKDLKKKAVKKLNLLSFGEEAEEEEKELEAVKQKIRSSHDVLNDPRLLKGEIPSKELNPSEVKINKDLQLSVREALSTKKEESWKESESEFSNLLDHSDDDEANFDARMRQQILRKGRSLMIYQQSKRNSNLKDHETSTPRSSAETFDDRPKVEKLALRKKGIGSEARAERMAKADADLQLLGEAEQQRQLQKQKKRRLQGREDEVLAKLQRFQKKISAKPVASETESRVEGDEDDDIYSLRGTQLKFTPEPGKDRMSRSDDPNDYVVHDPLLEKGKEKFNKMQAKQKRREREWAGKSLT